MGTTFNYIGHGIYSIPDAARLTGIHPNSIRRWVSGYNYTYHNKSSISPPVISSTFKTLDSQVALAFLDLIEIRFINAFKKHGISLIHIRKAYKNAKNLLSSEHPFATRKFKTDGKVIIAEIASKSDDIILIELAKNQLLIEKILQPYLFLGLEFADDDLVFRWWPMGKKQGIVIDPEISFGKPIVFKEGIPTSTLACAYNTEKSFKTVADWYEIHISTVKHAVEFENLLLSN
ncbi:MAG: helix-turn-helix domain-containing protein [Nitrosopumilus sp.]